MNRLFFSLAIALLAFATAVQAQDSISTTRIEAQHKPPSSMRKHLAQTEESLLKTIEDETPAMQAQAVQTIRDLEQMFPQYAFTSLVVPLGKKLKDEKADGVVRLLAALALDELHSDAGDAAIRDIAGSSQDKGLQTLCNALLVRSQNK